MDSRAEKYCKQLAALGRFTAAMESGFDLVE
jgi:hypothetical protein